MYALNAVVCHLFLWKTDICSVGTRVHSLIDNCCQIALKAFNKRSVGFWRAFSGARGTNHAVV